MRITVTINFEYVITGLSEEVNRQVWEKIEETVFSQFGRSPSHSYVSETGCHKNYIVDIEVAE
jgi:hypothetical protein